MQKEKGVFCAHAAQATAFEKAVQNSPLGSCEQGAQPFDKSKFKRLEIIIKILTFSFICNIITFSEFVTILTQNKTKERAGHVPAQHKKMIRRKKQSKVRFITLSAIIAALYVVMTLVSAVFGLSSGAIQIRISEALCVLCFFTPAAIPGLSVGCLIANLITGANILDVVFGTLATLLGAVGGYLLRKSSSPWLVTVPTVLANAAIIPFVIVYGFGEPTEMLPFFAFTIFVGELISATCLGAGLLKILKRYNFKF